LALVSVMCASSSFLVSSKRRLVCGSGCATHSE
jgi:hypothetical protein